MITNFMVDFQWLSDKYFHQPVNNIHMSQSWLVWWVLWSILSSYQLFRDSRCGRLCCNSLSVVVWVTTAVVADISVNYWCCVVPGYCAIFQVSIVQVTICKPRIICNKRHNKKIFELGRWTEILPSQVELFPGVPIFQESAMGLN